MNKLFLVLFGMLLSLNAQAMEKFSCFGTEPFWGVELTDASVTFTDYDAQPVILLKPTYASPGGISIDYVMTVNAQSNPSSLMAFVTNTQGHIVADKNGDTSKATKFLSYCSDGMSDRLYSYSINFVLDGKAYTGCCSTPSHPGVGGSK